MHVIKVYMYMYVLLHTSVKGGSLSSGLFYTNQVEAMICCHSQQIGGGVRSTEIYPVDFNKFTTITPHS